VLQSIARERSNGLLVAHADGVLGLVEEGFLDEGVMVILATMGRSWKQNTHVVAAGVAGQRIAYLLAIGFLALRKKRVN
jgi:hypothetical protein